MKVIAGALFAVFLALGFIFMVLGMNETMGLNEGPALIGAACFFAIIARIPQAHLLHNGNISQANIPPLKAATGCEIPEQQPTEARVASPRINEPHDNTIKVLIWGTIIFAVGFLLLWIPMEVISE